MNMDQVRTPLNAALMDFLQLLGHIKAMEELEELSQDICDFLLARPKKK